MGRNVFKNKFFQVTIGIILLLTIAFLTIQIRPFFVFVFDFITAILYPIIIAVVLYYVLRPIRRFLERRIPRVIAIVMIYFIIYLLVSFVIFYIWPYISQQISEFSSTPKEKIIELENKTIDLMDIFNINAVSHDKMRQTLEFYFQKLFTIFTDNLIFTLSSIAKIASFFIITPFILYYFLKDDSKMSTEIIKTVPRKYKEDAKRILTSIDNTLSIFITGQLLVALIVATLIFIGYWAIGLNYAFMLAFVAFCFNLIPFCGPFISTIPAVFIGLADSPAMAFKVICVVLIVHLFDLNLISPRIVGFQLNIHPITIILLLVASATMFGLLGLFLVTPLYAVLKAIVRDLYVRKYLADEPV